MMTMISPPIMVIMKIIPIIVQDKRLLNNAAKFRQQDYN